VIRYDTTMIYRTSNIPMCHSGTTWHFLELCGVVCRGTYTTIYYLCHSISLKCLSVRLVEPSCVGLAPVVIRTFVDRCCGCHYCQWYCVSVISFHVLLCSGQLRCGISLLILVFLWSRGQRQIICDGRVNIISA
jgi:hypothetical protein